MVGPGERHWETLTCLGGFEGLAVLTASEAVRKPQSPALRRVAESMGIR